jgi:hypothetical protein
MSSGKRRGRPRAAVFLDQLAEPPFRRAGCCRPSRDATDGNCASGLPPAALFRSRWSAISQQRHAKAASTRRQGGEARGFTRIPTTARAAWGPQRAREWPSSSSTTSRDRGLHCDRFGQAVVRQDTNQNRPSRPAHESSSASQAGRSARNRVRCREAAQQPLGLIRAGTASTSEVSSSGRTRGKRYDGRDDAQAQIARHGPRALRGPARFRPRAGCAPGARCPRPLLSA